MTGLPTFILMYFAATVEGGVAVPAELEVGLAIIIPDAIIALSRPRPDTCILNMPLPFSFQDR
ncbi:hypothetical protein FHU30_002682 [Actinomadura rupiterrae]|nr:hypothetical protein [Actinomadura rupiterrae]